MIERKITVFSVIQEGTSIGLKNALSLFGAVILWLVTIWIPYINVGTTIAMFSIPVALSRGNVVSPLFIFDAKYRQYMGEFFTLIGLMLLSLIPAFLFMVVPAYVIALGWSLAIYILLDKGVSPGEALVQSNKATNGYKWTIFGVGLLLGIAYTILSWLFSKMGIVGAIFTILMAICYTVINLGCNTVIYRNLALNEDSIETLEEVVNPLPHE